MQRVAVDFDGTIVENKYPQIGEPLLFAFETLQELQKRGFILILWTVRSGQLLDEAVAFCLMNGIEFYAVNRNHPEEHDCDYFSRKLDVDVYIDDRNLGGFPGWEAAFQMLCPDEPLTAVQKRVLKNYRKKSLIKRIFGK